MTVSELAQFDLRQTIRDVLERGTPVDRSSWSRLVHRRRDHRGVGRSLCRGRPRHALMSQSDSPRLLSPADFDRDALNAVMWRTAQGGVDEGWCPNYEIPARIPHQRLQGLQRRGHLRFSPARGWALTERGHTYRATLNSQEVNWR